MEKVPSELTALPIELLQNLLLIFTIISQSTGCERSKFT
jgi:hypothetical protein